MCTLYAELPGPTNNKVTLGVFIHFTKVKRSLGFNNKNADAKVFMHLYFFLLLIRDLSQIVDLKNMRFRVYGLYKHWITGWTCISHVSSFVKLQSFAKISTIITMLCLSSSVKINEVLNVLRLSAKIFNTSSFFTKFKWSKPLQKILNIKVKN